MSVIIKGMSLPEKCRFCPCCCQDYFCSAIDCAPEISNLDRRLEGCPLTEIPTPHGRLIDADKLLKAFEKACEQDRHWVNFFGLLESAPTIIEAEGVKE